MAESFPVDGDCPVAMHTPDDTHETEPSWLPDPTLGLVSIDHADPFQLSMSGCPVLPATLPDTPTALQRDEDAHETPFKMFTTFVEVLGDATIVQVAPFHCSTSVCLTDPLSVDPTARQLIDETQVMPFSESILPWVGLGSTDHVDPFHPSARVFVAVPGCC
jgi:hypothetical protein